jgi:restriction system protein
MTILESAIVVLKLSKKPLTAQEIFDLICEKNLFTFKAKDPLAILKAQLRRNSIGFSGKSANSKPTLKYSHDNKYSILE